MQTTLSATPSWCALWRDAQRSTLRYGQPHGAIPPGSLDALVPGANIAGAFRLEQRLGRGAMGDVFAATQLSLDRPVALKFMRAADTRLRQFAQEARVAAHIDHPHVVRILDFHAHAPQPFIVMERVRGEDLRTILNREGRLTLPRAARLLAQTARALAALHAEHIVHRDIKPANLMVTGWPTGEEHVTVVDFGLATSPAFVDEDESEGLIVGTPLYMSPEQIMGLPVDGRSDLYALGCLLFEILTGAPPPTGFPDRCLTVPDRNAFAAECVHRIEDLQRAMVAYCADQRPACAAEVARTLEFVAHAARERSFGCL